MGDSNMVMAALMEEPVLASFPVTRKFTHKVIDKVQVS